MLSNGHINRDGEEATEVVEGERGAVSTAIVQAQNKVGSSPITTPNEREELDEFRKETVKNNYFPIYGKKENEEASVEE